MGKFVVGDVVSVAFPFSDLSGTKNRPALVLAKAEFNNLVLCQITSKPYTSKLAIKILDTDFSNGSLLVVSYIRPDKLFTSEPLIIQRVVGRLHPSKLEIVLVQIREMFTVSR